MPLPDDHRAASTQSSPESGSRYAPCGIREGETYRVRYPFVRCTFTALDGDGPVEQTSWRPGIEAEPDGPEDVREVADAHGEMALTVVSIHTPGRYPSRVFYTRRWRDPDGREFGKTALRMTTVAAFRRRIAGFSVPYQMRGIADSSRTPSESSGTSSGDERSSGADGIET